MSVNIFSIYWLNAPNISALKCSDIAGNTTAACQSHTYQLSLDYSGSYSVKGISDQRVRAHIHASGGQLWTGIKTPELCYRKFSFQYPCKLKSPPKNESYKKSCVNTLALCISLESSPSQQMEFIYSPKKTFTGTVHPKN